MWLEMHDSAKQSVDKCYLPTYITSIACNLTGRGSGIAGPQIFLFWGEALLNSVLVKSVSGGIGLLTMAFKERKNYRIVTNNNLQ